MENKKRFRIVKLLAVIILLGLIALYCNKRWSVWFNNPIEPPYVNSDIPGRIQLTLGNDGQFSRNVSWQCGDTLAASQLFIAKSTITDTIAAIGRVINTQGGTTVSYHVKLTNLEKGQYSYSVCTAGKQSPWYDFNVNADDSFRFVYIGDIQDTIGGTVKNFFTSISQCERDAAFWILGGDVVECPHDQYWNEYFTSMESIAQTTPVIACPGNHEYLKGIPGKLEERFIYTFSYLVEGRNNRHSVFDTRYGNVAIITLDSNRDAWTLFSQKRLFEHALQRVQNAKWKIVVIHHPLYSTRGKFRNLFIRYLFEPLIRGYGVDIVLQGHDHCYARKITKDKNYALTTPIYLISHSSPKDYQISYDNDYDRFGTQMRFYQTIDVSADTLSLKTYTETGELYDRVHIVKTGGKMQVVDLTTDFPEHIR